jgi:hypothetical protein
MVAFSDILESPKPPPLSDVHGNNRRIAMAIDLATYLESFVDCCLFACCPGGCWGNTEQVVAQCRHPVASGVALDMLH